jgi:hypothetical protein
MQTNADLELNCFELPVLSWVALNMTSSTVMFAASSQARLRKPKIHHQ